MRLLLAFMVLASQHGATPDLALDVFVGPGDVASVVADTGDFNLTQATNGPEVAFRVDAAGGGTVFNRNASTFSGPVAVGERGRYTLVWRNDGPQTLRLHVEIDGESFSYVESRGLRRIHPDAWNVPAPPLAWLALAVLAAARGSRP